MLIRVDHKLRISLSDIPLDALHLIVEALEIPNIEREKAIQQNIWGGLAMPEVIGLWEICRESNGVADLIMPRGFYPDLVQGLDALGIKFTVQDNRYNENTITDMGDSIMLRPWQIKAVERLFMHEQGIWKAPSASGKTVGILEAIRRARTPSIVIVNTKDILYQWRGRAKAFLGRDYPVSIIGDGSVGISDYLTIATAQTLHSRFKEFEEIGLFDNTFGFMCLDECHHATAETYNRIVSRFSSRIRVGVSATPDKTGDFELATKVLGPIFHETPRSVVDMIMKPSVFKVTTDFDFPYRGAKGRRPSNYPQLLKSLVTNEERNNLIVKAIMMNPGSHSLVVSKRLEHLTILAEKLRQYGYPYQIMKMTGQESSAERAHVVQVATNQSSIIFSTLADEALDIPRLDSIFLVFPQRNQGLIEQQVGRVCRVHPAKSEANVYDFVDPIVGPLEAQWRVRSNVYRSHGYEITLVSSNMIREYELE